MLAKVRGRSIRVIFSSIVAVRCSPFFAPICNLFAPWFLHIKIAFPFIIILHRRQTSSYRQETLFPPVYLSQSLAFILFLFGLLPPIQCLAGFFLHGLHCFLTFDLCSRVLVESFPPCFVCLLCTCFVLFCLHMLSQCFSSADSIRALHILWCALCNLIFHLRCISSLSGVFEWVHIFLQVCCNVITPMDCIAPSFWMITFLLSACVCGIVAFAHFLCALNLMWCALRGAS